MPRLFTRGTSLYETEVMMVAIPNFKPRTSGTHTYRRMKDKEAGKCIYCGDYSKKIGCKHVYCPYILERAEMGSIDYAVSANSCCHEFNETFRKMKKIPNMQNRLDRLAESYDGNMFLSVEHSYRFYIALRKIRMVCSRPTNRYISAIYLLTTTSRLWSLVSDKVYSNTIDFEKINLKGIDIDGYAYYQMARKIYENIPKITIDEIADEEVINDTVFKILLTALLVEIYGANILQI